VQNKEEENAAIREELERTNAKNAVLRQRSQEM
jgi:hypothetical protein